MKWRLAVGALTLALCLGGLLRSDFGFYNPVVGVAAAGREVVAEEHKRELLRLAVTAADAQRLGGPTTLRRLSTFYGTDDSLGCSIRTTFKSNDELLSTRVLRPGQVVTLCLN